MPLLIRGETVVTADLTSSSHLLWDGSPSGLPNPIDALLNTGGTFNTQWIDSSWGGKVFWSVNLSGLCDAF